MQFKSVAFALLGVTGQMAHPFSERDVAKTGEFVEVDRKPASDGRGNLLFLGPGSKGGTKRADTDLIEERGTCHKPKDVPPLCDKSNTARNEICDKLVSELYADDGIVVSGKTQQICYEGDGAETNEYCCVSWQREIDGLTKGDFADIANGIMQECTEDGISGRKEDVYVHNDACTGVCLSNRGTDC
ncbi:hypothetical protein GGR53DRAFT_110929 [Hypoxylon sp. FL1150]|nr:hypothetical protein GGR53DRAFT_110929 [Hypoxylon sp. FL1150]